MQRLKEVLVEKHIGAILIALLLSQTFTNLVYTLSVPIRNVLINATGSPLMQQPLLAPDQITAGLVNIVLYGAAAGVLLKWLYFPPQPKMIDGAEDGDGQEADTQ